MTRREEILKEVEGLLAKSSASILAGAKALIEERGDFIDGLDAQAGGPMAVPKDVLCALLMKEIWAWGPPSTIVEVKVTSSAPAHVKRNIRNIREIRSKVRI